MIAGDRVKLRSGGPLMTISCVFNAVQEAEVIWWDKDNSEYKTNRFNMTLLKKPWFWTIWMET